MIQPANHSKRPLEIPTTQDVTADEAIAKAFLVLSSDEQKLDLINLEIHNLRERVVKQIRTTEAAKAESYTSPLVQECPLLALLANSKNLEFQEDPQVPGIFTLALFEKEPRFNENLTAACSKSTPELNCGMRLLNHLHTCIHPWGKILLPVSCLIGKFDTDWKLSTNSVVSLDLSLRYCKDELPNYMEIEALRGTKSVNGHLYAVPDILLTALAALLIEETSGLAIYQNLKDIFKAYEDYNDLSLIVTIGNYKITYRGLNIHTLLMMLVRGEPEMCYLDGETSKILQPCIREEETANACIPFAKFLFRSGVKFFKHETFLERFHTFIVSGVSREFIDLNERKRGKSALFINQFACLLFLRNSKERPSYLSLGGTLFQREFDCIRNLSKGRGRGLKAISDLNYIFFSKKESSDVLYTTIQQQCRELEASKTPLCGLSIIKQGWLDPARPFVMSSGELESISALMRSFFAFAQKPTNHLFEDIIKRLHSLENSCPEFMRTERFNEFLLLIRATVLPTPIVEESSEGSQVVSVLPIFQKHPYMQIFFNCALKVDTKELYDKFYTFFVKLLPLSPKELDALHINIEQLQDYPFPWVAYLENGTSMRGTLTLSDALKRQPVIFNDEYAHSDELKGENEAPQGLFMEEIPVDLQKDFRAFTGRASFDDKEDLLDIEDFIDEL